MTSDEHPTVVRVRPDQETMSRQRLPYFVGVSAASTGASGVSLNMVIIPPGGAAEPHLHTGYETAIYVLEGRVDTRYGQGLRESLMCEAGDFLFIGADVPHQPVNLSATDRAVALVARNDPNEQENVIAYDPSVGDATSVSSARSQAA
jgi:uncharacterized RmlC-like cupin family protein